MGMAIFYRLFTKTPSFGLMSVLGNAATSQQVNLLYASGNPTK